jgi:hypothetical protein
MSRGPDNRLSIYIDKENPRGTEISAEIPKKSDNPPKNKHETANMDYISFSITVFDQ